LPQREVCLKKTRSGRKLLKLAVGLDRSPTSYGAPVSTGVHDPSNIWNPEPEALVKTILRRLQQLEQRRSESLAANDVSGARERFLARINGMAERLSGDPNWEAMPKPSVEEVRQRLREALSRHKNEADQPAVVHRW
jgi:hypothetical protein